MPRLAFKPDASFVRFIALGAVGGRSVVADLARLGHELRPLENGSTDTKLWKDVKRKRVRIPDLVCTQCGLRVESRAKTSSKVAMSHSEGDAERAWDYGMVDADVIAFPVVTETDVRSWSRNDLATDVSSYTASDVTEWAAQDHIPYLSVADLRHVPPAASSQKGVTEGSETTLEWDAIYSSRDGLIEAVSDGKISVRRDGDGHLYTWQNQKGLTVRVAQGGQTAKGQVLASELPPLPEEQLGCPAKLDSDAVEQLLGSPERTQRFTGLKLARLRGDLSHATKSEEIRQHPEEDLYVRLEAATYLIACHGADPGQVLEPFLGNTDPQVRLEATLALAEAGSDEAVTCLGETLVDSEKDFFLRSAAAWGLGQIGTPEAAEFLLNAFEANDVNLREDALDALSAVAGAHAGLITQAVSGESDEVAAGAAEALRRIGDLDLELLTALRAAVEARNSPIWEAWLLGALRSGSLAEVLGNLEEAAPEAHFAILVVQRFMESWIAERWALHPTASSMEGDQG